MLRSKAFTNSELKTFEQLVSLTQPSLKKVMSKFLKKYYPKVIETKDYIFCEGEIPICLVAHMDTVFSLPPDEVFYDPRYNVVFSPQGLGADDRAGIFAILSIIRDGLRPHVILTTDEEKGGIGASAIAELDCPFSDVRYFIELDRRGANDCVFYDCYNEEFINYVEGFGFSEAIGSFSDICFICEKWGIAGVNLSVGYRDEHTESEVLFVGHLKSTIEKVKKMLTETDIPHFKFILSPYSYGPIWGGWYKTGSEVLKCGKCGKYFLEEEMFPVMLLNGKTGFYCPDCITKHVTWCDRCQSAFEKYSPEAPDTGLCDCCKEFKKK